MANEGQFPHHVIIETDSSTGVHATCAGALIGLEWVLTTASCVKRCFNIRLRIGSIASHTGGDLRNASKIFIHPSYNANDNTFNGALVRLSRPLSASKHTIVSIPSNLESSIDNRYAVTTGLGRVTAYDTSPVLRYGYIQLMDNNDRQCLRLTGIQNQEDPHFVYLGCGRAFVRARSPGGCLGDTGSPLVLFEGGRWLLLGVAVFNSDVQECEQSVNIFTNALSLQSWIKTVSNIS